MQERGERGAVSSISNDAFSPIHQESMMLTSFLTAFLTACKWHLIDALAGITFSLVKITAANDYRSGRKDEKLGHQKNPNKKPGTRRTETYIKSVANDTPHFK